MALIRSSLSSSVRSAAPASVLLFISLQPVEAQVQPGPIGRFVADARASVARYGQSDGLARAEGVRPTALASRGLGVDLGAHVYLARLGPITFGVGAHVMATRGSRTPPTPPGSRTPPGPVLRTTFTAFSPQLSFNFGAEKGWSYLSGGMGSSILRIRTAGVTSTRSPEEEALERSKTIDYGGGARWFIKDHLAFTLDLRFYAISPQVGIGDRPGRPRMTLMVVNGGVSFK